MERLYNFLEITKVFALCIPVVESSGFIDLGAVFLFGFYIHIVSLLRVDLFAFKFTDGQLCGVLADRFYFFITFFRLCGDIHIISACSADFSPLEAQAAFFHLDACLFDTCLVETLDLCLRCSISLSIYRLER